MRGSSTASQARFNPLLRQLFAPFITIFSLVPSSQGRPGDSFSSGAFTRLGKRLFPPTARPKGRKFSYTALFLSSLPHPNLASSLAPLPNEAFLPLSSIAHLRLSTLPALSLENAKTRNLPRIPRLPISMSTGICSTHRFRTHAHFGQDFLPYILPAPLRERRRPTS